MSGRHQRAQGLVEYGLIIAAAAIVSIAGLNAMTRAQEAYWGAATPTFASPTPSTGTFLHPTTVTNVTCTASPIKVGTLLTCNAVVNDTYGTPTNPPQGTIDWLLDGTSLGPPYTCTLDATKIIGSQNTCPAPGFQWLIPGTYATGPHSLVAKYGRAAPTDPAWEILASNHTSSFSSPLTLQFVLNLVWSVPCVNEIEPPPNLPAGTAEVGHPLRCQVTLIDQNTGAPVAAGTPVTWSTDNGPGFPGVGMFTCDVWPAVPLGSPYPNSTPPIDIFTDSKCFQPPLIVTSGTASITCWTDANGQCSILYRRLYDTAGGAIGSPVLTLSALGNTTTVVVPVVAPTGKHASKAVAYCTTPDGNVRVEDYSPYLLLRDGQFHGTMDLNVDGPTATQLSCTATVFDADNNPALDTSPPNSNPNRDDAHPPRGTVTFKYKGATVASCTLVRADTLLSPTQQARGQAPFASSCSPASTFPISGVVGEPTSRIDIEYSGDSGHQALSAAAGNDYQIPVDYRTSS